MLQPFFEALRGKLLDELSTLPLTTNQVGYQVDTNHLPYLQLVAGNQRLKTPQFKAVSGELREFGLASNYTIPSTRADKLGPYTLQTSPTSLVSVVVVEKPGTAEEEVTTLLAEEYVLQGSELSLTKEYVGGTLLQINYRAQGQEHKDRFEQQFTLTVHDQPSEASRMDQLAQMVLPVIWAHWAQLSATHTTYSTGKLQVNYRLSDLQFVQQELTIGEGLAQVQLHFRMTGQVAYRYYREGGIHTIDTVQVGGLESVVLEPTGGYAIGIKKEDA